VVVVDSASWEQAAVAVGMQPQAAQVSGKVVSTTRVTVGTAAGLAARMRVTTRKMVLTMARWVVEVEVGLAGVTGEGSAQPGF